MRLTGKKTPVGQLHHQQQQVIDLTNSKRLVVHCNSSGNDEGRTSMRGEISVSVLKQIVYYSVSVIRLSLGKLLVNLLQVVKRTNTPLISLTNGVVDRPWDFGSWVRSPHPP